MNNKEKYLEQLREAARFIQTEGHNILEQIEMIDNVEDAMFVERKLNDVWETAGNAITICQKLDDELDEDDDIGDDGFYEDPETNYDRWREI